jgi:drug/metabolite transporter (DMT)-like permease
MEARPVSVRASDAARLVALAVIWSLSFVFLRVVVPAVGPLWMATGRLLIGGLALCAWLALRRAPVDVRERWKAYLVVGIVNSALPFVLFGYGALHLPASALVILNATVPLFVAALAVVALGERLTVAKLLALVAGLAGVALVTRTVPVAADAAFALAVAAGLGASLCYAVAAVGLKRFGGGLPPAGIAAWSQVFAGVVLLPLAVPSGVPGPIDARVAWSMLALALVCSGVAYLLYFRLIRDIGPARASTVTFLMPAFGMLWGAWFLGESITAGMVAGAALIVAGTATVLRPSGRVGSPGGVAPAEPGPRDRPHARTTLEGGRVE